MTKRKMKDSGVEWIGEIPDDWEVSKFKRFTNSGMGNTILKTDLVEENTDSDIPVFSATQHDLPFGYISKDIPSVILKNGDLVIPARGNSIGFVKIIESGIATCTQTTIYSNTYNINPYYLYYCSIAFKELWFEFDNTAIPQITVEQVENNIIPICKLEIQNKIVIKLNQLSRLINNRINKIIKSITLLDEYKKSIITEAVTKGLDRDVPMKDSGIEWIGEIPEHWLVHRVFNYFYQGKIKNKLGCEMNLLSLSYGKIIKKDINKLDGLLPENFNSYNIVEKGDIIIRPTDLQNDKKSLRTGLVKERGIITSAYHDLKPKSNISSEYYHYLLHSYDLNKVFYNMGDGVRQGLTYNEFSKLLVLSPPLNEQIKISNYLDSIINNINKIIEIKKNQIHTLEEYKKSLIYEYVTGKKEVGRG